MQREDGQRSITFVGETLAELVLEPGRMNSFIRKVSS